MRWVVLGWGQCSALTYMWNGPIGKCFFELLHMQDGAVICSAFICDHLTAGHDEFRDIDRLIKFSRS